MRLSTTLHRFWMPAAALLIAFGPSCAGTGGAGCTACPSSSDYRFQGQKIADAAKVRMTQPGIDFLASHLEQLLKATLGTDANGRISVDLPEQAFTAFSYSFAGFSVSLNLKLKDANVKLKIGSLAVGLLDNPPRVSIQANNVDIAFTGRLVTKFSVCAFGACSTPDLACDLKNGIDVGGANERMVTVNLKMVTDLTIDAQGNFQPRVSVETVDIVEPPGIGVSIAKATGSAECRSETTVEALLGVNACSLCTAADFTSRILSALHGFLDDLIDSVLRGPLESAINGALDSLRGQPLKVEGRSDLTSMVGSFFPGSAQATPLGYLFGPGPAGFQVNGTPKGLDLNFLGGFEATLPNPVPAGMVVPHPCVNAPVPAPVFRNGAPPTLTGVDGQGRNYHLGALIGKAILNSAGYAAFTSGALCLALGSDDIAKLSSNAFSLNSGVLSLLLPGLRDLAGMNAPVLLTLEPTTAPTFEFGTATGTGAARDSLIKMTIQQLGLSFYALIGDRYARLVQVGVDLFVGISLVPQPNESLLVTIDGISISKITQRYNELLPNARVEELMQVLFSLATSTLFANQISIPVRIGETVEKALAPKCPASLRCGDGSTCTAGGSCPGPRIGMFVNDVKRVGADNDFLELTLTLTDRGTSPMADSVTTTARIIEQPMRRKASASGAAAGWEATGRVVLEVGSEEQEGAARGLEFQVSIDGFAWGAFQDGPTLVVESPILKILGEHRILVRARKKGNYRSLDTGSVEAKVVVDPIAPAVSLRAVEGEVLFDAVDEVTTRGAIEFAVRVDGRGGFGAWSAWRTGRGVRFDEIAAGPRVIEVKARDNAGNETASVSIALTGTGGATTAFGLNEATSGAADSAVATKAGGACAVAPTAESAGIPVMAAMVLFGLVLLRRRRGVAVVAVVAIAALLGGCDDKPAGIVCESNAQCGAAEECVNGFCQGKPRCQTANDCCPGQACNQGFCQTPQETCDDERPCSKIGQVCRAAGTDGVRTCGYQECTSATDCSGGAACFNGYCRLAMPCGGLCQSSEVCIAGADLCRPAPATCAAQTCEPGFLLTLADGRTAWGPSCNLNQTCACAELPSLASGDVGRYASIAVSRGRSVVSAYDSTFGDLVLVRFDEVGTRTSIEYVDGIPENASVRAGPSGVRRGVVDPGGNVGKFTSIAVNAAGEPRISYYDIDNKALKFAAQSGSAWQIHTVETGASLGANGDVGRYTSLVIDGDGKPAIAYFQVAGGADGQQTAVRLARAKSATPATADDWEIEAIDSAALPAGPALPCGGCASGQTCVNDSPARCVAPTSDCNPGCTNAQACVSGRCIAKVNAPLPPLDDIPWGVGVFPSLAHVQGTYFVSYYDRTRGNLKAAIRNPDGTKTIKIVDGEKNGDDTGNVGAFSSIAVDSGGRIGIAYSDVARRELRFYSGRELTGGTIETVDTGLAGPGVKDFVGADASLSFTAQGLPLIAYHDSSQNDLRFARRISQGSWSIDTVLSQGAHGFFTDMALDDGSAYIVSLQFNFTPLNLPANTLHLTKKPGN